MIPAYYTLLGENTTLIIAAMIPSKFWGAAWARIDLPQPGFPGMRAMASAILYFVLNIIGLGLGPLTVGILSDAFASTFGKTTFRYAMATTLTISLVGFFYHGCAQSERIWRPTARHWLSG
ncbi:MAG: hypothetical protein CM15mP103_12260 [Gammaproteobacteria bacterium]|nr:MAG: hypothetical protein CM15mP103_12260 [Gammaproteobacteria bacterium]